MPRRKMSECFDCPGEPAVGKYHLPRRTNCLSGWFPVCEFCAKAYSRWHTIEYYPGCEPKPEANGDPDCDHQWDKASLVTEVGGYDRMVCTRCGATGKRYAVGTAPVID